MAKHDTRFAGDGLKRLRLKKGLRQEDVATAFGVSTGQIGHYEAGRTGLSTLQLPAYAEALGVTTGELVAALGLTEQQFGSVSGGFVVQVGDIRVVPVARGRVDGAVLRWEFTGDSVYVSATDADGHILIGMVVGVSIGELRDGDVAIVDGDRKFPPNGALVVVHLVGGAEPFIATYHATGRMRFLYDAEQNMIPMIEPIAGGKVLGLACKSGDRNVIAIDERLEGTDIFNPVLGHESDHILLDDRGIHPCALNSLNQRERLAWMGGSILTVSAAMIREFEQGKTTPQDIAAECLVPVRFVELRYALQGALRSDTAMTRRSANLALDRWIEHLRRAVGRLA